MNIGMCEVVGKEHNKGSLGAHRREILTCCKEETFNMLAENSVSSL